MNISELQKEIHETAKEKGWWDNERSAGEIYALIHSEVSEAVECARGEHSYWPVWYQENPRYIPGSSIRELSHYFPGYPENGEKPQGELIELADVVIRILDYAESIGYKIELMFEEIYEPTSKIAAGLEKYAILHEVISDAYSSSKIKALYQENKLLNFTFTFIVEMICKHNSWDLWKAVRVKVDYNKTRPHRHGGKKY